MKKRILLGWGLCIFVGLTSATTFAEERISQRRESIALAYKTFDYTTGESVALFGARQKHFLGENWYWGELGYGVVGGKRAGYIEGGFLLGSEWPFFDNFRWDASVFAGAGGGGLDTREGGGLILCPELGLNWYFARDSYFSTSLGYLSYVNGQLTSPVLEFNLGHDFQSLGYDLIGSHPVPATQKFVKQRLRDDVVYEAYLGDNQQLEGVLGYRRDVYANDWGRYGVVIYGAATGIRGGYGIGGVSWGLDFPEIGTSRIWELQAFLGSGGGNGVQAGGGFAVGLQAGLRQPVFLGLDGLLRAGFLDFPAGNFHVTTIALGLSWHYDTLTLAP